MPSQTSSGGGTNPFGASVDLSEMTAIPDATMVGNNTGGSSVPVALTASQARTNMGLGTAATHAHGDYDAAGAAAAAQAASQPLDASLTGISGLSPSNDDILQRKAGAWANRTIAQLIVDLIAGGLSGFTNTAVQAAAYTAAAGERVRVDANAASGDFAVKLKASPSDGDKIRIVLIAQHATRKVTIDDNGNTIEGGAANDIYYTLLLVGDEVEFTYDSTAGTWLVTLDKIQPQVCTICANTAQTGIAVNGVTAVTLGTSVVDRGGIAVTGSNAITLRRAVKSGRITGRTQGTSWSTANVLGDVVMAILNLNGTRIIDGCTQSASGGSIAEGSTQRAFASGDSFTMSIYTGHTNGGTYSTADNTYGGRSELGFTEHR